MSNYDSTYFIEAWGDYCGDKFCCHSENFTTGTVRITGSQFGDLLSFSTSDGLKYLEYSSDDNHVVEEAEISGGTGNDMIRGSEEANLDFQEHLYGGDGNDSIHGRQGQDDIYGGDGADYLTGGDGGDYIVGGDGDDVILGNDGSDNILGGDGIDRISGGDGDDTINGEGGGDIICGDGQDASGDWLQDGDGDAEDLPDLLWGAEDVDHATCDSTSTRWDGESDTVSCEGNPTIPDRPSQCPD